ncbi:MAG: hypothetical protein QGD96_09235 [Anaerolineae bacterium]|nr:hypothetical protein [Anaerolineae bacterium]
MKRFILILGLVTTGLLLAACGPKGVTPDANGQLFIIQEDDEGSMNFNPESIVLTSGQTVTIILENQGEKDHEFMIGRDVIYNDDGAPDGFTIDFFEGWTDQVEVKLGMGAMLMIDGETVMMDGGMDMDMGDGDMDMDMDMDMDHMGWMVMDTAGSGKTTITFTVPDGLTGEWEMACFEDNGAHYDDGMRGTVIIVEP